MQKLLALVALTCAVPACSEPTSAGPLTDCELQTDGTMSCSRSLPGCTLEPDVAVQFLRCGHRYEYTVYGRAEGCPEVYYYPEGSFLSPADWEAYVGPCDGRVVVAKRSLVPRR